MLGKPAFNDVKEGIITAPLIYSLLHLKSEGKWDEFAELNQMVLSQFEGSNVPRGMEILFSSCGIELADKLSIQHILQALDNLRDMRYPSQEPIIQLDEQQKTNEEHAEGLVGLALKVKTRKY